MRMCGMGRFVGLRRVYGNDTCSSETLASSLLKCSCI